MNTEMKVIQLLEFENLTYDLVKYENMDFS
jgi:hypothetical protein